MLYVESYKNKSKLPVDSIIIDTTSRSTNWTKELSPFTIYGGHLYGNYWATNVENAWQAAKVYKLYDDNGTPKPEYFIWARKIWSSKYAYRYPMGRGAKPEYSWWDGQNLTYVDARKKIYVPIYSRGVIKTDAFNKLLDIYRTTNKDIYLIDFDGYNHIKMGKSLIDVLNDPNMKMGHGFVIYNLLTKMK